MKKNISVFFAFISFIFCFGLIIGVKADKVLAKGVEELNTKSKSAYLMDYDSKTTIYKCNENEKMPIASMCKVMSLLICFDTCSNGQLSLDETIQVSDNASGMGGSQVFLEEQAEYKCSELLKSIIVSSANDACVAMAERIAGSEQAFVELMNCKAKELGLDNTYFVNCTGLPKPGQYSCAKDVAVMFSELINHKEYFNFSTIWMDKIEHPKDRITEISNTNKLVRFYEGCDGGKTGYTSEAGHCLVATAKRGDLRLVSVVIHAPDSKSRFNDVSSMFNYGFANYTNKTIIDSTRPYEIGVKVEFGKKDNLEIIAERNINLFTSKNEKVAVQVEFSPFKSVVAPIKKGQVVGVLTVYNNGIKIDSVNMISNEDIDCKTYFDSICDIAKNWAI